MLQSSVLPGSCVSLPEPHVAYKAMAERVQVHGEGVFNEYIGQRAFYHLLSLPRTQHVAFALAALFSDGMAKVVIGDQSLGEKYQFTQPSSLEGFYTKESQQGLPLYTIGLIEHRNLHQYSPADALLHEGVHILLAHLCGSPDPARLVTLIRLHNFGEQKALDRAIYADSHNIPSTTFSLEEEERFNAKYTSWELVASRAPQIGSFRDLMIKYTPEQAEDKYRHIAPNFLAFYREQLLKDANELDLIIEYDLKHLNTTLTGPVTNLQLYDILRPAIESSAYLPEGYSNDHPGSREILREEVIARYMQAQINFDDDEIANMLPGIHKWYRTHIRPAIERFAKCAGILDSQAESAASILARPTGPLYDTELQELFFTPESLEIAYDPLRSSTMRRVAGI